MTYPLDDEFGIVLGICNHWWQADGVDEVLVKDCPYCRRPPRLYLDFWEVAWPDLTDPS